MPADVTLEKGLPHNLEAERSVLGAILLDNGLLNQAIELLRAEDFYAGSHRLIFEQMLKLSEKGQAVDYVTLAEELNRASQLENAGGRSFISSLIDGVPRLANIEFYARIIQEKATLRNLIRCSNKIIDDCYEQEQDAGTILDAAEKSIFDLAELKIRSGFVPLTEIAKETLKKIEMASKFKNMVTGIPTGYTKLDEMTSGLQPSDLIIVAARPSMGKTAFSLNMATHAAIKAEKSVGIFSLEMSSHQLMLRMLCSEAEIDAHKLRTGFLSKDDWNKIPRKLGELSRAKMFIDDTAGITLLELRAKCRRLKAERGLDLVVVDYLQLMSGGKSRFENRQQEISSISRGLKGLAKELNIPVIALSQLSRAPEQRTGDHRPQLSDLRESGSIEQDADVVAFIFREEFYKKDDDEKKGIAEIIIAKQRNGPIGSVELAFRREYTRFDNWARERG
ncbi:MAG: replicative DNA helicase [Acidobacteria bacterium]|nr:replicative DNA helicase [Acidobacteriota bacterium]MCI0620747.1 replicative DNA helicase [Acidobacteriota bacterium]MCI0719694.1 replicative DNA helicase [Acidobacteriota bacterium]